MNPYDLYAIKTALKIKEISDCQMKAITMGPPSATSILEEAVWMGCDDGYLLTDRKFAGADVVATAFTLSQGIKYMGKCDLIICGKQTTDGDTAQVGAELAYFLKVPYVCYVDKIIEVKEKSIVVRTNLDKTYETVEVEFPCLITVEKIMKVLDFHHIKEVFNIMIIKCMLLLLKSFLTKMNQNMV